MPVLDSLFRRFSPFQSAAEPEPVIDLSRAIKGYNPPDAAVHPEPPQYPNDTASQEAVDDLSVNHDAWLNRDLDQLKAALQSLQSPPHDPNRADALFVAAHNLKGMAGTYGRPILSTLCGSLCRLIQRGDVIEDMALINLHVEACRAAVIDSAASEDMVQAVCDALETQTDKRLLEKASL